MHVYALAEAQVLPPKHMKMKARVILDKENSIYMVNSLFSSDFLLFFLEFQKVGVIVISCIGAEVTASYILVEYIKLSKYDEQF